MALVVRSAPLAARWAPVATRDETWASLDKSSSSQPSSQPSSHPSHQSHPSQHRSADSNETPASGESFASTLNSSGTTESSGVTESSGAKASKKKQKQKRAPRGADVVLHVHDCAFAVHERLLRQKCRILHGFLLRLRKQNAIGLLAGGAGEEDDETQLLPSTVVTGGAATEDEDTVESRNAKFVLRQRDPAATPRYGSGSGASPPQRYGRCPVYPRQQLSDRATAPASSARSSRFPKVCCLAHQKTDDASREEPRPRSQEDFSPGKENYDTSPSCRALAQSRVALAPKMPFAPVTKQSQGPNESSPSLSSRSSERSPLSSPTKLAPNVLAVELIGASADAVAAFIEFLYSGKTCGVNEGNAATVTSLCKWFCMEDRLLYAALVVRAKSISSVSQWMDVLLCCTNLRSEDKKTIIIDYLIGRLTKLSSSEYCAAMDHMPLHRLAAIEDADILSRVLVAMVNKLRRTDTWKRLAFTVELWLFWSYGRRFAGPLAGLSHPDSVRQPMSLLDFHHQFVVWDPVTRIDDIEVTGLDAYVRPTTLFSFGAFSFQVRFEPSRNPLICWRVVRTGTPADNTNETEMLYFRPGVEPTFCIRGNLTLVYKCSPEGPLLQEDISIRYSHSQDKFGKWQVLLAAPSPRAMLMLPEPESEEKTQEPESSMDNPTPQNSYTEGSGEPTALVRTAPPLGDSHSSEDSFEVMTAHFTGQFFVWGHKLCNLYHFLLVSTLFYLVPLDASRELRFEATINRMRELPVDTLIPVLQSDRLRVPDGETTLAIAVSRLCLSDYGTIHFTMDQIRGLFQCVRWCYVDLEQIMLTLEHSRRELKLYELIEQQLRDHYNSGTARRCAPWYVDDKDTPYLATTTLVEFQIEAGDRSLSPSKFPPSQ